jgi:uncharacterized protein YndB with AHSA1/START domain
MAKADLEKSIWIDAPIERVWRAVTEENDKWFAIGVDVRVSRNEPGGVVSIVMDGQAIDVAEIEVMDPPREFVTRGLPDKKIATQFLLAEEKGGTRFTVQEYGYESLTAEEREETLRNNGAGWEAGVANLEAYVMGKELPRPGGF